MDKNTEGLFELKDARIPCRKLFLPPTKEEDTIAEITEPESLLRALNDYLLQFPKHNTHGSAIDCEDVRILTCNYDMQPDKSYTGCTDELQCISLLDPVDLVRAHTSKITETISKKKREGKLCIVRTYPEVTGSINGLRIYTRLQFGKVEDIILKLLPPKPDEII